MATRASPVVVIGDFNIHVDVADDPAAVKFHSVLTTYGYRQHVKQPTHCPGHVLYLILTNSHMPIQVGPIDPPLLSDHSFVVADISCLSPMSVVTAERIAVAQQSSGT